MYTQKKAPRPLAMRAKYDRVEISGACEMAILSRTSQRRVKVMAAMSKFLMRVTTGWVAALEARANCAPSLSVADSPATVEACDW